MELFLYTRAQCSACDKFRTALDKYSLRYHVIDVDIDPELVHRYGARVPVLVADEGEVCEGRVDYQRLRALKGAS